MARSDSRSGPYICDRLLLFELYLGNGHSRMKAT